MGLQWLGLASLGENSWICSLSSMFVFGPTILRNFLLWLIPQSLECNHLGHHTLNTFYRKLKWSMHRAWLGIWPTKDWNNRPINDSKAGTSLMGGYFLCIWALVQDLDHMTNVTNYLIPRAALLVDCAQWILLTCPGSISR